MNNLERMPRGVLFHLFDYLGPDIGRIAPCCKWARMMCAAYWSERYRLGSTEEKLLRSFHLGHPHMSWRFLGDISGPISVELYVQCCRLIGLHGDYLMYDFFCDCMGKNAASEQAYRRGLLMGKHYDLFLQRIRDMRVKTYDLMGEFLATAPLEVIQTWLKSGVNMVFISEVIKPYVESIQESDPERADVMRTCTKRK